MTTLTITADLRVLMLRANFASIAKEVIGKSPAADSVRNADAVTIHTVLSASVLPGLRPDLSRRGATAQHPAERDDGQADGHGSPSVFPLAKVAVTDFPHPTVTRRTGSRFTDALLAHWDSTADGSVEDTARAQGLLCVYGELFPTGDDVFLEGAD